MRPNVSHHSAQRPSVEGGDLSRHERKIQQRVTDFMDTVRTLTPSRVGKLTCLKYLLDPNAKVLSDSKSAEIFNDKFHNFRGELDFALNASKKESNRQEFIESLKTAIAKESLGNRYDEFVAASNRLSTDELIAWIGMVQKEIQPPRMKNRSPSHSDLSTQTNPMLTTQTTTQTTTTSTQPVFTTASPILMQQQVPMSNQPVVQTMMPAYSQGGNFVPVGNYFPATMPMSAMQVPQQVFPQYQQVPVGLQTSAYQPNGMMYASPAQFPQGMMMQASVAPMNNTPMQQFSMPAPHQQPVMPQPFVPQAYPQPMAQQPGTPQPYPQPAMPMPGIPQPIPQTILQPMAPATGNTMPPQAVPVQPAPIPVKTEAAPPQEQTRQANKNSTPERVNINRQLSNQSLSQLESVFSLYSDAQFNRHGTITIVKYLVNAEVPGPASNPDTQRFNDKFFRFTSAFQVISNNVRPDEHADWNFQVIRRIAITKFDAAEMAILTTRFIIDEPRNDITAWLNTLYGTH